MSLEQIERILRQRIGLHTESVGRSAISSAVGRRMASCDIGTVIEYFQHLDRSNDELHQLIETVVIPETWFFRDSQPFRLLKQFASECSAARPHQRLRALSVPCSTGEEPYSMAMMLLEAGIPAQRIQVDAVDISSRALEFARAGNYGAHSFRGEQDLEILERYFQRDGVRFQITAQVQALLQFMQGNLLDPAFCGTGAGYDVIFCRNLMIYFDDKAKTTAYRTLQRLLAPHGLLFVGHAECGTVPPTLFHSAGYSHGFAFRHGPAKSKSTPESPSRKAVAPRRRPPAPRSTRCHSDSPAPSCGPAPTQQQPDGDPLELARQLADLGRLQEAGELCAGYLKRPDRQVEAYFLLATIRIAEADLTAAEEALRRCLYLDPKHYECLIQMALLLQRKGETEASARMRQRAERTAAQGQNG